MKTVCLLGSTGSIGTSTLDVLACQRRADPEAFRLVGLAAGRNVDRLFEQVVAWEVPFVALADAGAQDALRERLAGAGRQPEIFAGADAAAQLVQACAADIVVGGITGAAGLGANLQACRQGARLALANKETLVMAGDLVTRVAREHGAEIVPVDSEHSALFQALAAGRREDVRRLILTASGGPFRTRDPETFGSITVDQALDHPTWKMGRKVTIDSATMMNKTLEVLEARWLFDVPPEQIMVVVHPQSLVHSMVEYCDGSIVAQLSVPDMRLPIQYALSAPVRRPGPMAGFRIEDFRSLSFEPANPETFPALALGFTAAERGGTLGAALNGANEVAVERFLTGELRFVEIAALVAAVMDRHDVIDHPTLDDVLATDAWARAEAGQWTS